MPSRINLRLLFGMLLAVLLASTAELAGTAPAEASRYNPETAGAGAPQFATACPSGGAEAMVKTVAVTRPATSGGRSVSVQLTLKNSGSPIELHFKVVLLSGDYSPAKGDTFIISGEDTLTFQITLPTGMPSDGFRVVVQVLSADQSDDCGTQEYEVLPGLPETFYRYWYLDGNQSFPVLVPADYFSPIAIAEGISRRAFDGSKYRENRIRLYQSIALELARQTPLRQNVLFEFDFDENASSSQDRGTAADVFEKCPEAAERVVSSGIDVNEALLCAHLGHLGGDSFFGDLPIGGSEFNVVFSAAVERSIEVQEARQLLEDLKGLPSLDGAWGVAVARASAELMSTEELENWSGELKEEISEIVKAVNDLKRTWGLVLEEGIFLTVKEGAVHIISHTTIPVPYVYVAFYTLRAGQEISKFVFEETGNFWEDVSMASAAAQVYASLQMTGTSGDGAVDPQVLGETLRYTRFAYYQHLQRAADNALLNPGGLGVNLIFNLGDNTPDQHVITITRLRDVAFDDIVNVRWNPGEDFIIPEVAGAQGIWSDGTTIWVLGRPAGIFDEYRNYRLFAYDMRTKQRVEEKEIDDLNLSEPRGLWGDDQRLWITDSGRLFDTEDKIIAFDRETGQRLSDPHIELGRIWLTGIWSQPNSDLIWYADAGSEEIKAVGKAGSSDGIRAYTQQRGKLTGAGNFDPQGIWSDGDTMWVADSERKRIFAYNFPNYWDREYGREFETLNLPDTLANASPTGIWSDGTTMWVADSEAGRIFAYDLEAPPRCIPRREAASRDPGDGNLFSYNPSRDFGCLPIAEDSISSAIWYDERGWMWVVDYRRAEIHALDADTREQVGGQVFDGLGSAGNEHPQSIWSNGQTMWVLDSADRHIYAYGMHSKEREQEKEFELEGSVQTQGGIWSDGSLMYVVDTRKLEIHAYDFDTKARDEDADFKGISSEGNSQPRGIWSDGSTMWVLDSEDEHIYAYDLKTKERVLDREFLTLAASGNSSPFDITSDGIVMWVLDSGGNRIFSYNMPPELAITDEPEDTVPFARNRSMEFSGLADFGLALPHDIWSDGTTMWITNGTTTAYAFDMASRSRVPARDLDTSGSDTEVATSYVWGDEDTLWTWPGFRGIDLGTREAVSTGPLPPSARAPSTGKGIWSDGDTFWVSALGYRASLPAIWQCLLLTRILSDRDVPGATEGFILAFDATTGVALPEEDFPSLPAAGNNDPSGIWSNGVTLWVADRDDAKIYAYDMASQERTPDKDFDNLAASGNLHPAGIWSDGRTMWVTDSKDGHIYAYNMPSLTGVPPDPDGGTYQPFSRNEWEDFRAESPWDQRYRRDIWSDGETMWLFYGPLEVRGSRTNTLYAYDMAAKNRIPERDITISGSDGLASPSSIWTDGTTMWVGQVHRLGPKILAFDVDSRARNQAQDPHNIQFSENEIPYDVSPVGKTLWVALDTSDATIFPIRSDTGERDSEAKIGGFSGSGNESVNGIWTDGQTLWVSDEQDDKIYAYDLATGDHLPGKDFNTLRDAGNNSPDGIWSDGRTMWVTDKEDNRIYAYDMPPEDGARLPDGNLPGPPGYLSSASAGYNGIRLAWSPPDDDGGRPITGYRIQTLPRAGQFSAGSYPLPTDQDVWNNLAVVSASNSRSYIHGGLLPQTAMHHRVAAVNSVGQGPWSAVVTSSTDYGRSPGPPEQLAASPRGETRIDLSWELPSDTGGWPIRSYAIERSGDGENWTELANVESPATSYSHTGLEPESRHHYRVRARARASGGPWSGIATAVASLAGVPEAPRELTATGDSLTSIKLSWLPPASDGGSSITAYHIQISGDGSNWRDLTTITEVTDTTHSDLVLERGGSRHYRVAATNVVGTGPWSNVAAGSTESPKAPGPPLNPEAKPKGYSIIELSWNAPASDGGSTVTGFEVEFSADGTRWASLTTTTAGAMFYSHTGLPAESTRHYRVAATNAIGRGAWSEVFSATTERDPVPAGPGSVAGDRIALVALYHATNGPGWANNGNWLSQAPLNQWYGVTTDRNGRVTKLDLLENLLNGPIPPELGRLGSLISLRLLNHSYSCVRNVCGATSPTANRLTGPIPSELENLASLRDLNFHANQLTGPIPHWLGDLPNLRTLVLSNNPLSGAIPDSLIKLKGLWALAIGGIGPTSIHGTLPDWLGSLSNLRSLHIDGDGITGVIPPSLANLTKLQRLSLGSGLSGPIPAELGNLTDLKRLSLSGHRMTGPIPPELGRLTDLENLSLRNGMLTGPIPAELGNLTKLQRLSLSGNQLSGEIPGSLGNLSNLEVLGLNSNRLTGPIPAEFANLVNIRSLYLSGNQLTGCVPAAFKNVSHNDLSFLNLPFC